MKKSNLAILLFSSSIILSACDTDLSKVTTTTTNPTTTEATTTTNTSTTLSDENLLPVVPSGTATIASSTLTDTKIEIKESTISEETKTYFVDIKYPVTGNAAIDADIKAGLDEQITTFKTDVGDMPADTMIGLNSLSADYEEFSFNKNYISIKFTFSIYTGGAHPNSFFVTKTYDTTSGKPVSLASLFQPGKPYLNTLSKLSVDSLITNSPYLQELPAEEKNSEENTKWITEGASAKEENYQDWVLKPDSLEIYFEPYQVASYAEGSQTVEIKLTDLKDILVPYFIDANSPAPTGTEKKN